MGNASTVEELRASGWEQIPYTPGDPQPRIADAIYRGIRMDGAGGFIGVRVTSPVGRYQLTYSAVASDLRYRIVEEIHVEMDDPRNAVEHAGFRDGLNRARIIVDRVCEGREREPPAT